MKTKNYCLFTNKNKKFDNNIYNILINGGFIRKLCSGIFIILPNGLRIINNIINIIKLEMNNFNCLEIKLPSIIPSILWKKSGRLKSYGDELYKIYDRNNKLFLISPTNEEVITNFFFKEKYLLNNFPYIFYQINDKFRDEIRPRFSLVRCKEFIMKDAYSFHKSLNCLNNIYYKMIDIYKKIFNLLGLNIFYKKAKCGKIGGSYSHEFHVLSNYGENNILINKIIYNKIFYKFKNKNIYLNNLKYLYINKKDSFINKVNFFNFVKTYILKIFFRSKIIFLILLIAYYNKIDLNKVKKLYPLCIKIKILDKKDILNIFNINYIFLGPFGFNFRIIADNFLINYKNFLIGSNLNNYIFKNVNWILHINVSNFVDIKKNYSFFVDKCKYLDLFKEKKSMEIAHVFKLSNYYSNFFNNNNNDIFMGCYGIGVFRIFISLIESYSISGKLILPLSISNFKIGIIPINMYNIKIVYNLSFKIYRFLIKNKIEVLIENRDIYFGNMINDFEYIGIPNIIIISERLLLNNLIEFRDRFNKLNQFININKIFDFLLFKYIKN